MLDRLRLFLSRWLFSPLQGTTLRVWWRALADNGFVVHPVFWPRALLTTLNAANNSLAARRQRHRFGARIERAAVRPPLFILGHYRSGTTHLHNLLAQDPQHSFVNNYQANFPRTFLETEETLSRLAALLTMRRRPHDNVRLDLRVPTEDELALCSDTLMSPHMGWHFPRRAGHYAERYLTFETASPAERERWIESLRELCRKLAVKYGETTRPVLKSPPHTARVPLLLEAFPEARFVHLQRDPYTVFQSTVNMERKVEPLFRYQISHTTDLDQRILDRYRRIYESYLRHRPLIADRLVEVRYEELDADPLAVLERIYRGLDLEAFDEARPHFERYLDSLGRYRKNVYPPLEASLRERITTDWAPFFEAWGYPT